MDLWPRMYVLRARVVVFLLDPVTTNWRTTIGITMSSSVKKGLFVAGNPNELGLGYYSLVDESNDPYLNRVHVCI